MTPGKVRRDSAYLRSHPYAGGLRVSSKLHIAGEMRETDFSNAFSSIKNYIVSSAADLVKKITGSSKRLNSWETVSSGDSFPLLTSRDSDETHKENLPSASGTNKAQMQHTKSWINTMMSDPNISENVKIIFRRMLEIENGEHLKYDTERNLSGSQRTKRRYIKPKDPSTSRILSSQINRINQRLSFSPLNPQRLAFGEIESRPMGFVYTPNRQNSKEFSLNRSYVTRLISQSVPPRPPRSYGRPWSSTSSSAKKNVSRGVGRSPPKRRSREPWNPLHKRSTNSRKSDKRSTKLQTYSPLHPRKIFSWEQS